MSKVKSKIPVKNYVLLGILTIITILLTFYINAWMQAYKENKLSISPFEGVVDEVNINEIELTFAEMNDVVLYVGYTNDKTVYEMEERLIKYIKNSDIVDKFVYVNVTEYMDDDEYLEILKETFDEVSDDLKGAPMLIYVKNGQASEVVNSVDGILHTYDVANLNESYELDK